MKILGIIGKPLGHSFSKSYFEAKFAALGLTGEYRFYNFPLDDIAELSEVLARYPDLIGFSVTIPYKREIIPWLDRLSYEARAIGAVNCVSIGDGKLTGHNTDAHGFRVGLTKLLGEKSHCKIANGENTSERTRALVLGTGGAASAVRYVLENEGIEYKTVSRSGGNGILSYDEITPAIIEDHKLIINTTPLGTYPDITAEPTLPYDAVGAGHYLYDLVYNPAETAFMKEGSQRGAAILNGETMLHAQAEKAWTIWHDNPYLNLK